MFHVLVGHLYIFFGKMSIQIVCPCLIVLLDILWLICNSSFYILDTGPFIRYVICTYFIPFCEESFHFIDSVF